MTRHKGQRTARMNERDFPHIVELPAENVMLSNMDRLMAWHRERAVEY
jgi:hypothetical protein